MDTLATARNSAVLAALASLAGLAAVAATPSLRAAGLLFQPSMAAAAASGPAMRVTIAATVIGAVTMRVWATGVQKVSQLGSVDGPPILRDEQRRSEIVGRISNPVFSASVTGLTASIALSPSRGAVAASTFAGAFVAMSPPSKLQSTRGLLVAAALAGLAQAALAPVAVGAGGKLGVASALGVFFVRSLRAAAALVLVLRARASKQE